MTGPVYDVFTASNGCEVRTDLDDGDVIVAGQDGVTSYVYSEHLDALRELFQHERDRELGRWRWPEHPEYVVYPQGRSLGRDLIIVINESDGHQSTFVRNGWGLGFLSGSGSGYPIASVAQAYFEAHPEPKPDEEPKPWENAQDGEIWEMQPHAEYADYTVQYLVKDRRFFQLPLRTPSDNDWKPANFPSDFVDGRRIWPEADQ